jgi:hypothetical protein
MQVPKLDFAKLDRLITRADAELRETEDALISFIEQQQKRDRLYSKSQEELKRGFSSAGWAAWHDQPADGRRRRS